MGDYFISLKSFQYVHLIEEEVVRDKDNLISNNY